MWRECKKINYHDNSKTNDSYEKVFYKTIFGNVKEVEILRKKKIIHIDFNYESYEYIIRFKNGRIKVVDEKRIF